VITVDDDIVLDLLESMDSKMEDLKNDNEMIRKDIEYLKSNPVQSGETSSVICTCDAEKIWKNITLTFIKDQEKAFESYKDTVKTDLNEIRMMVKKLENVIIELRKQSD